MVTARRPLRAALVDLLPSVLWRHGTTVFGGRLHFCVGVERAGHGNTIRTLEWCGNNVAFGRRAYDGVHVEGEPNQFDDPDSYQHYDDLRGQLDGLLIRLRDRIDQAAMALLVEFLDAGEYGLTLEQLADVLSEQSTPITTDERSDMLALNEQMRLGQRVPHALDFCPTDDGPPGD